MHRAASHCSQSAEMAPASPALHQRLVTVSTSTAVTTRALLTGTCGFEQQSLWCLVSTKAGSLVQGFFTGSRASRCWIQCTSVLQGGKAQGRSLCQSKAQVWVSPSMKSGFIPSQKPQGQSDHMDLQEEKEGADQPSWFPLPVLARQLSGVLCSDGASALVLQSTWLPQSSTAFVQLKVELLQDALVYKGKLAGGGFSHLGGSVGGSVVGDSHNASPTIAGTCWRK